MNEAKAALVCVGCIALVYGLIWLWYRVEMWAMLRRLRRDGKR